MWKSKNNNFKVLSIAENNSLINTQQYIYESIFILLYQYVYWNTMHCDGLIHHCIVPFLAHTHAYIRTVTCVSTHMHTHINTHIHTYIHTNVHTYKHTHIRTRIQTYTHVHICTYTHTQTHTNTHSAPHKKTARQWPLSHLLWKCVLTFNQQVGGTRYVMWQCVCHVVT